MTLDELKAELGTSTPPPIVGCDPCKVLRMKDYVPRGEKLPKHIVLVQDEETGSVSYMRLWPDGHLGAVTEDC